MKEGGQPGRCDMFSSPGTAFGASGARCSGRCVCNQSKKCKAGLATRRIISFPGEALARSAGPGLVRAAACCRRHCPSSPLQPPGPLAPGAATSSSQPGAAPAVAPQPPARASLPRHTNTTPLHPPLRRCHLPRRLCHLNMPLASTA